MQRFSRLHRLHYAKLVEGNTETKEAEVVEEVRVTAVAVTLLTTNCQL